MPKHSPLFDTVKECVCQFDLNSSAEAEQIANTILENVKAPMSFGTAVLNFSTSIGIALAEIDDDADSVLKRADDALYSAKAAGRSTAKIAEGDS